ncbi:MAG: HAD family hydrolase [Desulfobacterales bacterium]
MATEVGKNRRKHHPLRKRQAAPGVAFIDPLRLEAREAVEKCRRAGITVLMVTGDHPATAATIARQLAIAAPEEEAVTSGMG